MHTMTHNATTTLTSDSPIYTQSHPTPGLNYSIVLDGVEYRSASAMHIVEQPPMYTDAYLFNLASDMFDRGYSSIDVVEHMTLTCAGTERERIERIASQAFDPSGR